MRLRPGTNQLTMNENWLKAVENLMEETEKLTDEDFDEMEDTPLEVLMIQLQKICAEFHTAQDKYDRGEPWKQDYPSKD